MADTPRIFGKPMLQAHENGLMWCNYGVWLTAEEDDRWHWEISLESSQILSGSATRRRDACRQIERAITRIREAARKLGT